MDSTELGNDVTNVKIDDGADDATLPVLGAGIICVTCGAMPVPCCGKVQQDFTLRRFDDLGRPSESPGEGLWTCERHRPQLSAPKPRVARVVPVEALVDFENLIASEAVLLEEAATDQDDVPSALKAFREEITRGLAELKKAVAS
jgi:hypothetical protein